MGVGSGLGARLVIGQESGYGSVATLDHSYEFDSESVQFNPTWLDSVGLHGGGEFARGSRTRQNVFDAAGTIPMDFVNKKMGLLVKHCLGSSAAPAQIGSSTAYKQIHQPGPLTGKSLSAQIGRPQTDGTCKPFTELGGKISQWALSCSAQQLLKLALDFNFRDESVGVTSLASYSPPAGLETFAWQDASLLLGGTASTSGNVVTVADGVAMTTLVTGFTLTGANPMKMDRYGLGGAGSKSEPISNALRGYSLALDGEFTDQSEIYDPFRAETRTPVQILFTGSAIDGSSNYLLEVIIPQTVIKKAAPNVAGPDVVAQQIQLDVYDDGVNAPIQWRLVSTDTSL